MMTPDEFVEMYQGFVQDLPDALADWNATEVEFRDQTRDELKNLLLKRATIVDDCRARVRRLLDSTSLAALKEIVSTDELLSTLADAIQTAMGLDIELFIVPPQFSVSAAPKAAKVLLGDNVVQAA